ncbi:MAG: hypothetical protein WCP52_03535 [Bacteroidota bacterium]
MFKVHIEKEGIIITHSEEEVEAVAEIWKSKYVVIIIKNKKVFISLHITLKDANTTFNEAKKKYPCTLSKIDRESEEYKSRKTIPYFKIKAGKIKL